MDNKKATLILEDGSVFLGRNFGASGESLGEIVFNTSMTGYQEILTDPSYYGQHVVMTYPLIGNYGINPEDFESSKSNVFGLIVKEYANHPSHWRSKKTLDEYLKEEGVIGISELDTRMITKKIREKGTMKAILTTENISIEDAMVKLKEPLKKDQVAQVSLKEKVTIPGNGLRIVVMDFGSKNGIVKDLLKRDCEVVIVPYNTKFQEINTLHPDGVLLSNGPGDPKDVEETIDTIREIIKNKIPLLGICLGHQLLALASDADTEKLKFGHRGGNHPVKDLGTNSIYMTSQNHGYTVTKESINPDVLTITHIAVNDGTIEGLALKNSPGFSIQYHPEASPGPYDSSYLFDQFIQLMTKHRRV
ncbi:MAG: carbamoyl phosphate synthase small subunit [Vulcanibacillus sp.]